MSDRGRRSVIYGEMVTSDGRAAPVDVLAPLDKGGIPPDRLNDLIDGFAKVLDDGASLIETSGKTLDRLMKHLSKELHKQISKLEAEYAAQEDAPPGEVVRGIAPQLAETMMMADKVTLILDRLTKMQSNAMKAQDQAVRLRTFIATGDQDDHGLDGMSENALRRLVNATLNGESIPAEQRRG